MRHCLNVNIHMYLFLFLGIMKYISNLNESIHVIIQFQVLSQFTFYILGRLLAKQDGQLNYYVSVYTQSQDFEQFHEATLVLMS